jgi:hypothetical protein
VAGAVRGRLVANWAYGGFLAGLLLAALTPLLAAHWPGWMPAVWLMLPLYMVHQLEEHDADRFRRFVNERIGGGREVLSPLAVFVINVPGVWGVIAASLYLAAWLGPGLGLIAVYLVLVNAAVHVAAFVALRRYNPGLVTAVVAFLPAGIWALLRLSAAGAAFADHALGLMCALAIHAAIVAHVRIENARLRAEARPS